MEELNIWLDTYDDLYSDFDSRNYLKRRISEDFIDELSIAFKYQKQQPQILRLLLPAPQRNTALEQEIIKNIGLQLKNRLTIASVSAKMTVKRGLQMFGVGVMLMTVCVLVELSHSERYLLQIILRSMLEPAAWFMIWNGLDRLVSEYGKAAREISFYYILTRLKICFGDILPADNV